MMATHSTRSVPITKARYPKSVKNDEIFAILIENGPLYNMGYTKPIVTLEGNHSSGLKVVLTH